MRLRITGLLDKRVPNQERLLMHVNIAANLRFYLVHHTFYTSAFTEIVRKPTNVYWFPSVDVAAGDEVLLFTGPGVDRTIPRNQEHGTIHIYHWGLEQTIWNTPEACAVLLELADWQTIH